MSPTIEEIRARVNDTNVCWSPLAKEYLTALLAEVDMLQADIRLRSKIQQQTDGRLERLKQQLFDVAEARDVAQGEVERLRALLDGRPWTAWDTADRHRTRLATVLRVMLVRCNQGQDLVGLMDEAVDALEQAGFPVAYQAR